MKRILALLTLVTAGAPVLAQVQDVVTTVGGTIPASKLGTGTPTASTVLFGNGTWGTPSGGSGSLPLSGTYPLFGGTTTYDVAGLHYTHLDASTLNMVVSSNGIAIGGTGARTAGLLVTGTENQTDNLLNIQNFEGFGVVVNKDGILKGTTTNAWVLPVGDAFNQPGQPGEEPAEQGMIRYNGSLDRIEGYGGSPAGWFTLGDFTGSSDASSLRGRSISTTAPTTGQLLLYTGTEWKAVSSDSTVSFVIDGGGATPPTGLKGSLPIDFNGTIVGYTIFADQSGSATIAITKDNYTGYNGGAGATTVGTASVTGAIKASDTTLAGWATQVDAGDVFTYNLSSATTLQRVTIALRIRRR